MSGYFPPDVSLRLKGEAAADYLGTARNLFFRAVHLQQQSGKPVQLFTELPNGGLIRVLLLGSNKIVEVVASPPPVEPPPPEEEFEQPSLSQETAAVMYSGVVKGGFIEVDAGGRNVLSTFRPTLNCAQAYSLPRTYESYRKLAVNHYRTIKPSMFSGAMKRVVGAQLGLGIFSDTSPLYLTGTRPLRPTRAMTISYRSEFARVHGLVPYGPQQHWLVEIDQDRGIHAMPLPLLSNTMTAHYRALKFGIGDHDTVRVLDEFGGLPSGENFPDDDDALAAYVDSGHIIKIADVSELDEFYHEDPTYGVPSEPMGPLVGWAFNPVSPQAANVVYRAPEPNHAPWPRGQWVTYAYRLTFSFSPPDRNAPRQGTGPCGTGSVKLDLMHKGIVAGWSYGLNWREGNLDSVDGGNPGSVSCWYAPEDVNEDCLLAVHEPTISFDYSVTHTPPTFQFEMPNIDNALNPGTLAPVTAFFDAVGELHILGFGNPGTPVPATDAAPGLLYAGIPVRGQGLSDYHWLGKAGAVFPAYCREGLLRIPNMGFSSGLPDGYFAHIGMLDLPHNWTVETAPGSELLSLNGDTAWHFYADFPIRDAMCFGAVVNPGPTLAYVMSNGLRLSGGRTSVITHHSWIDYNAPIAELVYTVAPNTPGVGAGDDCLLDGMDPTGTNFIGSV
jgi:hypothetical protein